MEIDKQQRRGDYRAMFFQLGSEPGDDISADTTVAERLSMVEILSQRMFEFSGIPKQPCDRAQMPVIVRRRS
ncbi:MAG: hypothetical protein H7Z40_22895 [Phycisphaerae bacterium]|nr:hypothetical protein [Gemmatimonadaceae bacterium]